MTHARFGMIGLGTMGRNLALNIESQGFPVAVWNLERAWVDEFLAAHPAGAFHATTSFEGLVRAIARPRRIMMMIPAGTPVDETIASLRPLLQPGDVLIDGGNSWYQDTRRREAALRPSGVHFLGCGVSGGEEGARLGPSLMPGGPVEAWDAVREVFEAIAAKTEAGACVTHVGPDGSGHYVKMVHNGIEYGDMQLIAEAWDVLRRGLGLTATEAADVFEQWNRGPLESFLVELTARVSRVTDPRTGDPLVDAVLDRAGQKGTGRWTVQVALDLGIAVPTIAAAVDARVLSSMKGERAAASTLIKPPAGASSFLHDDRVPIVRDLEMALHAARLCTYAQGMSLIRAGSAYGWHIDLSEIARIWKGGCIIRAKVLDTLRRAFTHNPALPNLLLDPDIGELLESMQAGWRRTIARGAAAGIPLPAHGSALAYFDSYRSARLPQNLTQALRDAFGAHTYERVDRTGSFHSDWLGDDLAQARPASNGDGAA